MATITRCGIKKDIFKLFDSLEDEGEKLSSIAVQEQNPVYRAMCVRNEEESLLLSDAEIHDAFFGVDEAIRDNLFLDESPTMDIANDITFTMSQQTKSPFRRRRIL